ncbi:MAG: HAD family hydrolase [Thermodesulfobacteriota bacterium]
MDQRILEKAARIKLVLLDVDGVMTDGSIILDSHQGEAKSFHVRDGHGVKLLKRAGLEVGIISGRNSSVVSRRAQELGIEIVEQGSLIKLETYQRIRDQIGLKDDEIAYLGDDVVDIPVLREVGLSAAVADALEEVKKEADYTTRLPGGKGAVRELAEFILRAQGKWAQLMERYFQQ